MNNDTSLKNSAFVCEHLTISKTTLKRLRKTGLPFTRVGSSVRYNLETINQWLNSNTEPLSP
jgi:excisionase family DNA binding protein